jgi:hypothetical protein
MLFLKKNDSINHLLRVSGIILSLDYVLAMTKYCYLKQKSLSNFITPDENESLNLIATENDFKIEDPPNNCQIEN